MPQAGQPHHRHLCWWVTAIPTIAVIVGLCAALVGWVNDLSMLDALVRLLFFLCLWVPVRWLLNRNVIAA